MLALVLALVTVLLATETASALPPVPAGAVAPAFEQSRKPPGKHGGKHAGKHVAKKHPKQHACPGPKKKKRSSCTKPKPVWTPRAASTFNYPFAKHRSRYRIRNRVLHAIEASPKGSRIRLATFTFVDGRIAKALLKAKRRGVSVQLLVNRTGVGLSPPYRRVSKALGHRLRGTPHSTAARASFVKTCSFSCRGRHGNLHSKIFLFSQVGHARWVSMVGSANLTSMASYGQWNTMDTMIDRATYRHLITLFNQMKRDRVPKKTFDWFRSAQSTGWVFPRPVHKPRQDPTVRALRAISCRAPAGTGFAVKHPKKVHHKKAHHKMVHHKKAHAKKAHDKVAKHGPKKAKKQHKKKKPFTRRTVIRISMYAWFDRRGDYLAKEVRRKWNQGCDVKIIYSVLNGFVKRTLYSPTGRGRIPMRRVVRIDPVTREVVSYSHSKYIALSGGYAGKPAQTVWTGSMNFTGLGVVSDDVIVRLKGHQRFASYLDNFHKVWRSPYAKVPLPTGAFDRMRGLVDPEVEHPRLGSGSLAGLEKD